MLKFIIPLLAQQTVVRSEYIDLGGAIQSDGPDGSHSEAMKPLDNPQDETVTTDWLSGNSCT